MADAPDMRAEQDALEQLSALPYDIFLRGPPVPPCEKERVRYVESIDILDRPPDPEVEHILTLISKMLSLPVVVLSLCSHKRVFVRNALGYTGGSFPWRWTFCGWSLVSLRPEILVVEDALEDARLRKNELFLGGEQKLRFFVGVPLIGSNGHRLGSLTMVDANPRQFTAQQCAMVINMAELVVRELEKDAAAARQAAALAAAGREATHYMRRALDSFHARPVLFVDVKNSQWRALHSNTAAEEATGISFSQLASVPLWDLLQLPFEQGSDACQAMMDVSARGDEFLVRGVAVVGEPTRGPFTLLFRCGCCTANSVAVLSDDTQRMAASCRRTWELWSTLPARMGALDEDTAPVGVPAYVPSAPADAPAEHFFVIISPDDASQPETGLVQTMQTRSVRQSVAPTSVPIEGLRLGPLLGKAATSYGPAAAALKGSFGRVYRARFKGKQVAVKICSCSLAPGRRGANSKPWRSIEEVQARHLSHPSIIRTFKRTMVLIQDGNTLEEHHTHTTWQQALDIPPLQDSGEMQRLISSSWASDIFADEHPESGSDCGDRGSWSDDQSSPLPLLPHAEMETWLVLEYCNRGTLQSGIDRGWFQKEPDSYGHGPPSLPVLLHTAREIADAMMYLHDCDIIHGDLCGGNILLTSSGAVPHGFTCKVADFGLARDLELKSRVETAQYGTVTYMPPELLVEGKLSKAADIYAFGILLWEMACSARAWAGMSHTQVLTAVGYNKKQPRFPDYIDKDVVALASACLEQDPAKRPTFQQVLRATEEMLWEALCAADVSQGPDPGEHPEDRD